MNILLQMGIGLGVVSVIMWLVLILRKKKSIKGFLYAGVVTVFCIVAAVFGVKDMLSENAGALRSLSAKEMMTLAYSLADCGSYDESREMVTLYGKRYGYDEECSLFTARTYAMQGNYAQAAGIYKRLLQNEKYAEVVEEESEDVIAKASVDMAELGTINYLISAGQDVTAYGYTAERADEIKKVLQITDESIAGKVKDAIEDSYEIDNYEELIGSVSEAARVYTTYGGENYKSLSEETQKEISSAKSDLEDAMEDYEGVAGVPFVREAQLKLRLLTGEFDEIAADIDENATYTELVVVSALYRKNAVKDKHFAEEYIAEYENSSKSIYKRLKNIYREVKRDLSTTETLEFEGLLEFWNMGADYPALMYVKSELEKCLKEEGAGSETSKVYLELAQIEHFFRNDAGRENSISQALEFGYESEDAEYRTAMNKISGIIENEDDYSEIMRVGDYVQDALDNAIPVETYGLIPKEILQDEDDDKVGSVRTGGLHEVSEDEVSDAEELQEFANAFTDYVSKLKSSMVISSVNTDNFETIEAYVSVSSNFAGDSEELKEILALYDCGFEIKDFTLEKVEYDSVRTHLLCDVSGSMSGSMDDLCGAVAAYVNSRSENESVAVTSFASGIVSSIDFGASDEDLLAYANGMRSGGGTAIYSSVVQVLNGFPTVRNGNHVLIVMTDGQDGGGRSKQTILSEIGGLADNKNVTVHTIGLGNVDADYLNTIAVAGNGTFVYVSDSESLKTFYDLLHGQVTNQYKITYKAEDTMTLMNRTLEVKLKGQAVYDTVNYSVGEEDSVAESVEAIDATTLSITGLKSRHIYKSKVGVKNALIGTGFTAENVAILKLVGDKEYLIELEYESETCYNLTIPARVEVGMYDVVVSVGGKKAVLSDGLVVEQKGEQKVTAFGPYSFTSVSKKLTSGNTYLLSGNVVMNGWLRFKGDVEITGDLQHDVVITVKDNSGSYVMFDDFTATGLGTYFAQKDIFVELPALGKFELVYDNQNLYEYDNYKVEDIYTPAMRIMQIATLDTLTMNLYPDRMEIVYQETKTELPSLEDIFDTGQDIFSFEAEGKAILNSQNIGLDFKAEAKASRENYCKVNMMNAPVLLNSAGVEVSINTWSEEYEFSAEVELVKIGMAASVGFKGRQVDKFSLKIDKDKTVVMGGVPVTYSDFMLGAEDIADAVEKKKFSAIKIVGGMDISAYKVSAICPPLKEFVGDVSLLKLDDARFELDLQPIGFKANTELKFLEQITLAKSALEVGTFDYSNGLLGLPTTNVCGIKVELTEGFEWHIDNLDIVITATGKVNALSRFFGVEMDGEAYIKVSWWWFSADLEESADVLMGVFITDSGAKQFTVIAEYLYDPLFGAPYTKRDMYYLDENGKFQHDDEKIKL